MSKTYLVDANYRFIAASQEVNARIAQRQQALALYVSLILSLLAALVALRPAVGMREPPIEWLTLGFPVSSICFAFLNYKAERAISNLRAFLSALERLDNAHETLPSYNTDPRWSNNANQARRFHDYAAVLLVAGGNAAGLGAALGIYQERFASAPFFVYATIFLATFAMVILALTPKWSYQAHA